MTLLAWLEQPSFFGLNAVPLTMVYGIGVVIYIYFTLPAPFN
jgi:hypothetical protein